MVYRACACVRETALVLALAGLLSSPAAPAAQQIVDSVDGTYGSKIRELRKDAGHEHNFYYYRDPWNADGSRMLGIQSDLEQKNWRVCLYDGDGVFLKELFPTSRYDWRLCWDQSDPNILYTFRGPNLYRFDVAAGQAGVLKSFAPEIVHSTGPSINQAGDRILVITVDEKHQRTFRSYHLPDMSDERAFRITAPAGCTIHWDKPHYTGYRNCIDTAYSSSDRSQPKQGIAVYDDTGVLVHTFEGIGGGGHYDWSPDGKLAYFNLPLGPRSVGGPRPLEIHVVDLDGTNDRVLFSVPKEKAHFHNLHLSWPRKRSDWFVAGFFPSGEGAAARPYQPPFDEILMIRLDGTTKYLARTGTVYSTPAGRGREGDMFWAQPLPRPSADGKRICFNSNRSATIDLNILYTEDSAPQGR